MKLLTKLFTGVVIVSAIRLSAEPPERKVFAHYMTCFGAPSTFYEREIRLAQRYGIDGFALNCGAWQEEKNGKVVDTHYPKSADRIFDAAKRISPDFKLMMSPDFAGKAIRNHTLLNVGNMIRRYDKHPNLFRWKGKGVLSGYAGRPEAYAKAVLPLRKEGYKFLLVPKFSPYKYSQNMSLENSLRLLEPDYVDGFFHFAIDGTARELMLSNSTMRRASLFKDKIFMAGVSPAYNSPNLRDFQGIKGYGAIWDGLIQDGADWVEITTWNDYQEDSNLMPYRWYTGGKNAKDKVYYNRDEAYLDATSYYIMKYKTGVDPEITQDRIYYSYRKRSSQENRIFNSKTGKWEDLRFTSHPYDQVHDDVKDQINVSAFLLAPAELTIRAGDYEKKFQLPKGIQHVSVPLKSGVPQFILTRKNKVLIDVFGRKTIFDTPTKVNSAKGYHLVNRTWMTGAVAGEPVKAFEVENASVLKPGGKLEWNTGKLEEATYNIRITYRNADKEEARLTMKADGIAGHDQKFPNYIPLFLPSTDGKSRTTSFLWTLWKDVSRLGVYYDFSDQEDLVTAFNKPWENETNDHGNVVIEKIELIPVARFKAKEAPLYPEMVSIPGGAFTMGIEKGKPDEAPAHKVTISPFAIGKYEVTNKEFEEYRSKHRKVRDGYSWRDRDPVIYVSWKDAAAYCNWLSEKHGLKPVYDKKSWKADRQADGFRLPTEAEWEYVATGRGQNRVYPWGNEKPKTEYGNFELEASMSMDTNFVSSPAKGMTIVGSYPKGISRDGVYDLAGNVSEWMSDRFLPYAGENQVDPLQEGKSHHRVIRGGSWGYYNHSQRNKDREFNNDGYPGYVYIGFRLAISADGYKKLLNKK